MKEDDGDNPSLSAVKPAQTMNKRAWVSRVSQSLSDVCSNIVKPALPSVVIE